MKGKAMQSNKKPDVAQPLSSIVDKEYKLRVKPVTSTRKAPDEQGSLLMDEYNKVYKLMTTARKVPDVQQERDKFLTPNYAIDLLIPFIPKEIKAVWEPAYGTGKISRKLRDAGYTVFESDIKDSDPSKVYNFITDPMKNLPENISIITNPPFSIKDLFIERCFEYGVPFAMLINADYSQTTINWIRNYNCQKIIPTARISFITPNILRRIHEGEVWKLIKNSCPFDSLHDMQQNDLSSYRSCMEANFSLHNYKSIDETPTKFLYAYSSAQFHSMWLTWKFNLTSSETFVDLPLEQRRNNI